MLNCREVTNRASDLIEGDLDLVTRLKIRAHLLACRHCRRFARQMRATVALLGHGGDDESSAPVDDDLLDAYKAKTRRKSD